MPVNCKYCWEYLETKGENFSDFRKKIKPCIDWEIFTGTGLLALFLMIMIII
jgi:hypothetical protein